MQFIKKIPWWGWVLAVIVIIFAFGETKVKVGNVSVGGVDLGGYDSEKKSSGENNN